MPIKKKVSANDLIRKVRCPVCHQLRSHPADIALIKDLGECCSCDRARGERDYEINDGRG